MRAFAEAFQREVADSRDSSVAGVAHRVNGVTKYFGGDLLGALTHLEQAVAMFDPARDRELSLRFTADAGVLAMAYLADVLWLIGEVDRARRVSEDLTLRIVQIQHGGSIGYGRSHRATFEMMRGDFERAAPHAKALAEFTGDHDIAQWQGFVTFFEGWKEWRIGNRDAGVAQMRRGVSKFAEQKFVLLDGLFKTALAHAEAEGGEIGAALSTIEGAIAESERTGQRTFDAEVHRMRGEILLKQDASNPAAEECFLTAIAIAQAQKARSFELRAALSLARLYRATGRGADAHAALGPALEGFAPTPEFPEIAEARALFDALAQTDEVKAVSGVCREPPAASDSVSRAG
jgi:predicted ATPase